MVMFELRTCCLRPLSHVSPAEVDAKHFTLEIKMWTVLRLILIRFLSSVMFSVYLVVCMTPIKLELMQLEHLDLSYKLL